MPIQNHEIAKIFEEIADLLEIKKDNPYRIRAYRTAASFIMHYPRALAKMVADKEDLTQLPGIGKDLAEKIQIIVRTGKLPQLRLMEKLIPKSVVSLLALPGLGPKRANILFKELGIKNLAELKRAAKNHQVCQLHGFSEKTEKAILQELQKHAKHTYRYPYFIVDKIVEELLVYLKHSPAIQRTVIAGSYRRKKDTVGDLDILIIAKQGRQVTDYLVKFPKIVAILAQGSTRVTVQLLSGLQIDFRVVKAGDYGAALVYFTGSKAHNIAIRAIAVKRNLKLNEYGVFKNNHKIAGKTEQSVYKALNLDYIAPELRENTGEIAAAQNNQLPKLITLNEIRGDLHCHTHATDGRDSIEAMAQAAMALGYEYLAITDHTQRLAMVRGQDPQRVLAQIEAIDRLNAKLNKSGSKIQILKSAEVDILENGSLDLPDSVLKRLDLTVCSVHSKFNLSLEKQTERIVRAMDNPYFTILGHPHGRLINKRPGYQVNFEVIFAAAKQRGRFLEINAQPYRLDLNDELIKLARKMGIKMAISTDAHSVEQFNFMQYGVDQARRGWLEADDVINTRNLKNLLKLLKK